MFKNQSNLLKENEQSSAIAKYLNLCNDSSDLLKFMCDQNYEISPCSDNEDLGDNLDLMNRSEGLQDGRAPSPASISSLASGRRLEWDSGADVGYQPSASPYPNTLSTLERMALGGCAEALIRTDPEGTNSCSSGVVNPIHNSLTPQSPSKDAKAEINPQPVTSPREVSGTVKLPVFTNNEAVNSNSRDLVLEPDENKPKSTSYDDDNHELGSTEVSRSDIMRSDASDYCPDDKNTNENLSSDEDSIFKPIKSGMNTNSASSSSLASTIINPLQDSQHMHSKKLKSSKKLITRGIQVGGTVIRSESHHTLERIISSGLSTRAEGEDDSKDIHGDGHGNTTDPVPEFIATSSFDRANSFEFFPGEMCDRNASRKDVSEKIGLVSDAATKGSCSLSNDLEEYIARVIQKKLSAAKKKALVKDIVERIIESDYCDDVETKNLSRNSTKSSIKSVSTAPSSSEEPIKLKRNKHISEEKIFVPYRPIPGGKTYLVAGEKIIKNPETSGSCSGSEISRPAVFYLPVDRVKPMKNLNSTSEERSDSALSSRYSKTDDDERYNSCLKNLKQLREQLKNKHLVAEYSESEGSSKNKDDVHPSLSRMRSYQRQCWWNPETKSEKKQLLEATKKKQNPVLNFLEREKESQLNWIKNEINHLSNLAQLLEECEISKDATSTSLKEQMYLLSSLEKSRKASKYDSKVDKPHSSVKSSFLEEPIVPDLKNTQFSSLERASQSASPILKRDKNKTNSVDYCSNQSAAPSSSFQSRTSSRASAVVDRNDEEKVHRDKSNKKTSEAYLITFEARTPEKNVNDQRQVTTRKSLKEVKLKIPNGKESTNGNLGTERYTLNSLREQLEVNHPEFIRNAEERQKCLEELAHLRALRQEARRKLLRFNLATHKNLQKEVQKVSKPKSAPAVGVSKSSGKQKENCGPDFQRRNRRLKQILPEYQKKEAELKKKQNYQTNRLLADIYSKKLQKKVLKGAVSLAMSDSVISTL